MDTVLTFGIDAKETKNVCCRCLFYTSPSLDSINNFVWG